MSSRRRFLVGVAGLALGLTVTRPVRAQSVAYTYDALGRVVSVTYPNGVVTTYTYDAADNRTGKTTGGTPPPPPPPLTVAVSATSWSGTESGGDPPIVATPSGGTPPYVYLWQRVSGSPDNQPTAPTAASTAWFYVSPPVPDVTLTTARCRVTDSLNVVAYSGNVQVTMSPE